MPQNVPHTVGTLVRQAAAQLADSPTPMLDARALFLHVSGLTHADLIAREAESVTEDVATRFDALLAQRRQGAPVAHLVGAQEFYGRLFFVTPHVLIPRPETEMLVDAALRVMPEGEAVRLLDLGTGSGCLLGTLLAERPQATGWGVDLSAEALNIAERNLDAIGVAPRAHLVEGEFAVAPEGPFDLIISNPPYIEAAADLPPSVKDHEPSLALFAGPDGLDAYRALAPLIATRLAPYGSAFLEIGTGQGTSVKRLMKDAMPSRAVSVSKDLAGHERMVTIGPAG